MQDKNLKLQDKTSTVWANFQQRIRRRAQLEDCEKVEI
jgi:hypothetical protein